MSTADLIVQVAHLTDENKTLTTNLEVIRNQLLSEALRVEDLSDALEEACDCCEQAQLWATKVARWRRLLPAEEGRDA